MAQWIIKDGYETNVLANEDDLDEKETQIQLVSLIPENMPIIINGKQNFSILPKGKEKYS